MSSLRFFHSLRFKVTLGVVIPLVLILAAFSYVQYSRHRDLMMNTLARTAGDLNQVIEGSLQHAMLTRDPAEVQHIVDDIAARQGVVGLVLLNKRGEVRVAPAGEGVGNRLDINDPTCQLCHQYMPTRQTRSVVLVTPAGERLLRTVSPIANGPACQECHPTNDALNGVLITDVSMAEIDRHLAADQRQAVLLALGMIVISTLIINLLMHRLVVRRLESFLEPIRRIARGDFSRRVPQSGQDEIGHLAQSFNHLADGLKEKAALERQLAERTTELEAQSRRLAALNTIAATVSRSLDPLDILDDALDRVLELMGFDSGWVFLREDDDCLRLVAWRGLSEDFARQEAELPLGACVCSEVLQSGRARMMEDMRDCQRLSPDVIQREGLICHVSVPLQSKDRVLGIMNLACKHPMTIALEGLNLLTAIGHQIGVAVENARLYEELQEREALRGQLLEKVIAAQEEERKRVARELHDELGQGLTALLMSLEGAEQVVPPEMADVKARLARTQALTARTLAQTRKLILDLRPAVLDDLGLVPAIRWYAEGHLEEAGVNVSLEVTGAKRRLPAEIETALFRIIQEAINNVARHSGAQQVHIALDFAAERVVGVVQDDGCGFDVGASLDARDRTRGLGLAGMRERAALIGGALVIDSRPGKGTKLVVEVPLGDSWPGSPELRPVEAER